MSNDKNNLCEFQVTYAKDKPQQQCSRILLFLHEIYLRQDEGRWTPWCRYSCVLSLSHRSQNALRRCLESTWTIWGIDMSLLLTEVLERIANAKAKLTMALFCLFFDVVSVILGIRISGCKSEDWRTQAGPCFLVISGEMFLFRTTVTGKCSQISVPWVVSRYGRSNFFPSTQSTRNAAV